MPITRVLIAVKTYPTLSDKYDELVCTAGFREDGSWIRIYPIPFRKLDYDQQFSKYDWIEVDLERNTKDFRKESYKPVSLHTEFKKVGEIDTRFDWKHRRDFVLQNVHTRLSTLIKEAKDSKMYTSLAVFKPREILDFVIEKDTPHWDPAKLAKLEAKAQQTNLFEHSENPFKVVDKLPYKFSYVFIDDEGRKSTLMIEDWELGALYWTSCKRHEGDEAKACADVRKKYLDEFVGKRDLYFYLGTTRQFHQIAPNPFIIIGAFYPPKVSQTSLF